ncbi:hypothetical protein VE00_00461 [Pseudogymnoascus sp. WSF 3629]|nr:hypothetical protein VE00_00461 [Pseudogymnoascus sp. WSF 3629]
MKKYLEIACFNAPSALIAADAGADRIELCANRSVGGTTPLLSDLAAIKPQIKIPVMVMIRPRGGDFIYSSEEFVQMKEDMKRFRGLADGFVFGILKQEEGGEVVVDGERNEELVDLARPLPCTFHRAVDGTSDYQAAVREVARYGFRTVLTSGGIQGDVVGGYGNLPVFGEGEGELVIMPGGGVRRETLEVLGRETRCRWFHSSGIVGEGEVSTIGKNKGIQA